MKASELKKMAFDSIAKEIADIESIMKKEANKGMLRMEIATLSDAAKQYLVDNGFEVKIFIEPGQLEIKKNKFTIHWNK